MKVLLTGGSGFLGKYIVDEANSRNHKLVQVGRDEKSEIQVDLSATIPEIPNDVDCIVHAAGMAHFVPKTEDEISSFFKLNLEGTKHLIEAIDNASAQLKGFVFISTVAVYGMEYGSDISERAPLLGQTPYAKSKIQAEELLINWSEKSGVPVLILRLPLVIGNGAKGNLAKMIRGIKHGKYVSIAGGAARKSMVLAEDVAKCIFDNVGKGGIYNLTDGKHPSFGELEQLIAKQLNRKIHFNMPLLLAKLMGKVGNFVPKSPVNSELIKKMSLDLIFNDLKARKELKWQPNSVIDTFKVKS
jgi:GlcNAc-P-P-Und epimerase